MCTAVAYVTNNLFFGRTLDYDRSYGEGVTMTPRRFPLRFRSGMILERHHAIIGMACVAEGYPLYYDGMNEKGLAMAGLNFTESAVYSPAVPDRDNVAHFEFIPWILGQCASVREAKSLLERLNLTDVSFSPELPVARLHWLIADREESVTVEAVREGLMVIPNPVGGLTNEPPFETQLFRLNDYMHLTPEQPENRFSDSLALKVYSRGMGALGLPGDLSSVSRFVRASFVKMNSLSGPSEEESVTQFFHILGAVEQQRGCCLVVEGKYEITRYTSCCSAASGIYYYTTYDNRQITAVDLHREDLEGVCLRRYPLELKQQIKKQN